MQRSQEEVERLVKEFQRLVKQTARKYFPQKSRDEDLMQCGLIGLWEAAKGWEEQGEFPSYAMKCIHHAMYDYLLSERRAPLPTDKYNDQAVDDEPDTIDRLDLMRRIEESWPPNSRERYILTALSNGVSKLSIAAAIGRDVQTVKKIAVKALEGVKKEDEH